MKNDNDLHVSLAQALQDMKMEQREEFDPSAINLAELQRRTGISRAKLRRLKSNNFKDMPHALTGRKSVKTVMTGYESVANNLLRQGVKNSSVIFERLQEVGYKGSLSGVKRYINANKTLLPPVRYAAGCCAAMKQDENAVVVVLPSDHVIPDVKAFQKAVKLAAESALNDNLVTFGIVPTFPAIGYGYVKCGTEESEVFTLEKFVEKPCLEKAQEYLASGEYSWNSGMFVFKAKTFIEELKLHNLQMAELSIASFEKAQVESDFIRLNAESFGQIKGDSIDYAVMEKTSKGKVVKLNAGWDDVGSWSALYDISKKDENLNVIKGDVIPFDTTSSYIRGGKRTIATNGLDNVVIVDSDDSLLIAAKEKIQDVKLVAEEIKKIKG